MMPMKIKTNKLLCFTLALVTQFGARHCAFPQPDAHQPDAQGFFTREHATGNWQRLRDKLLERGIEFFGSYTADFWGNISGSKKRGAVFSGLADLGVKLDLDALFGWQGASLHNNWLWLHGRDPSETLVGEDFFGVSNIAGYNTVRMFELWLQQAFLDDALSLRVGQMAADQEFAVADYAGLFLSGTFGFPLALTESLPNGGPQYPMAVPGARLELNPAGWFTLRSAVFQGDPFPQNLNRHGFRYRLNSGAGALFLNEAELRWQELAEHPLPGSFKVGAWFHTAKFADPLDDKIRRPGNRGAYFILEQKLYTPAARTDARPQAQSESSGAPAHGGADSENAAGLGAFTRIAFQPPDRNSISLYADAGLVYRGIVPSRRDDSLGIALGLAKLSSGAIESQRIAGASNPGYSVVLEAAYHAQITPWLCVQPDVQYIVRPGASGDTPDAVLLGVRCTLQF